MRAGDLRHRVTIQRKSVTRDAHGGEVITWVDVGTYWGNVQPLRGREFFENSQEQAQTDTRITLRNVGTITTVMRAVHESVVYDITQVIEIDKRNRTLEILCRVVTQNTGV